MKKKILIAGMFLLAVLTLSCVSASENLAENGTEVSDELLVQTEIDTVQQPDANQNSTILESAQSFEDEILQASDDEDNLSAVAVENPEDMELLGKTPSYLDKTNIWYQTSDLNAEDSNMWILNDNAKAFPKDTYIKIVATEKGGKYKAEHTMPVTEIVSERGMENIHYFVLLREFTDIQFQPHKTYNLKIYHVTATGKARLIGKKKAKIKMSKQKWRPYRVGKAYYFYRYLKNDPNGDYFHKVFKTHPNDKQKIKVIIYKKNGKFYKNKKVRYSINHGQEIAAKTNSRGLLVLDAPKKTGTYRYEIYALKGSLEFKVKVSHSVSIPKVALKKSAKKVVIPLQLRKIDGKFYKNKKITFKLDNKTYNLKTNKKGIAKVTIKKSVLKKLDVGQNVKLSATYNNDTITRTVKVRK